jgi:hypothetical protein
VEGEEVNAELPVSVEVSSGVLVDGGAVVREEVWVTDLRGRRHLGSVLTRTPEEAREHARRLLEAARKAEEVEESSARLRGR